MDISVSKEFTFHAAHHDETSPAGDPCGRVHGHTYKVRVTVLGKQDSRGMVIHGNEFKWVWKRYIEPHLDHNDLNETLANLPVYPDDLDKKCGSNINPTMENTAIRILWAFKAVLWSRGMSEDHLVSVRLWETPTMFCDVQDGGFGE